MLQKKLQSVLQEISQRLVYCSGLDIHGPQKMNPNNVLGPLTFSCNATIRIKCLEFSCMLFQHLLSHYGKKGGWLVLAVSFTGTDVVTENNRLSKLTAMGSVLCVSCFGCRMLVSLKCFQLSAGSSPPSCSSTADTDDDDADDHTVIIIHYTPTILCSNSNYRVIVCLAWKT